MGPLKTISIDFAPLPNFEYVIQYFAQNLFPQKNLLKPLIPFDGKAMRNFVWKRNFQNF